MVFFLLEKQQVQRKITDGFNIHLQLVGLFIVKLVFWGVVCLLFLPNFLGWFSVGY